MRRRSLLRTAPLALSPLAGCTGGGDGAAAPSAAASPTPRATVAGTVSGSLTHLDGVRRSTAPGDADGQNRMTYSQRVDGRETTLSIDVPDALVAYYSRRFRHRDYGSYVSDGYDDEYVRFVAGRFAEYGEREGLTPDQVVDHAMGFVQQLTYATDIVGTGYNEYPKYPVETLVDRGGDCEDTSILLAAVLEQLGYGAVLLLLPDANHAALGIRGEGLAGYGYDYGGDRYYYVETTAAGYGVGQAPEDVQGVEAIIVPIDARPSLVAAWGTAVAGPELRVKAAVRNVGKGAATAARVRVDLLDEAGEGAASAWVEPASIPAGGEAQFRAVLQPPADVPVRVRLVLYLDEAVHDYDTTELLRPARG